ncbi:MAG: sigma 54-interacting transcriptional regulator, partial [Anaerolineae bacterium]|nr:sigma 54-interacting transcriptional regulator [Anaerolineae bacterium]
DARILSATHKDLAGLVAEGKFREDLYYRINVIELRVPPLREREKDVLILARRTLERLAKQMGTSVPALTPEAEGALCHYEFPGNVRELENILERAITLAGGRVIDTGDIQLRTGPANETPRKTARDPLGSQLQDVEREAIVKALEQTKYNKTAAARLLGISFRALRYRIKKLGLE